MNADMKRIDGDFSSRPDTVITGEENINCQSGQVIFLNAEKNFNTNQHTAAYMVKSGWISATTICRFRVPAAYVEPKDARNESPNPAVPTLEAFRFLSDQRSLVFISGRLPGNPPIASEGAGDYTLAVEIC